MQMSTKTQIKNILKKYAKTLDPMLKLFYYVLIQQQTRIKK